MTSDLVDVAIVGGGPAGLAAAAQLRRQGVERVVVLEREAIGGGVPRHCGHPPFGMREFGRLLAGPAYTRRLVSMATESGAELRLEANVVEISPCGDRQLIRYTTPEGLGMIKARRVLLATGTRESPRSARLLSGDRPLGVINTGALQAYAYLEKLAPFSRPVIVGTELVALSAILTCRSLGAKPVAMIEENARPTAPYSFFLFPRLLGIPVLTGTNLTDIAGMPRVTHVTVEHNGEKRDIDCDGVILSGKFISENHLARLAGLVIDRATGGPEIDQFGRSSNAAIYAAGNLLRPVETAGWSFREGRSIGSFIARDLFSSLPQPSSTPAITLGHGLRYAMPQRFVLDPGGLTVLQLRVDRPLKGELVATDSAGKRLYGQRINTLPERRVTMPLAFSGRTAAPITISIHER